MRKCLLSLFFAFSAVFSQGLSKRCVDEIHVLSEKDNFVMQDFMKELPTSVTKVKAQVKAAQTPVIGFLLGPGEDSKLTDAGITVGCAKTFPENSSDMQASFSAVQAELGYAGANAIDTQIENKGSESNTSFWVALAFDLIGAGFIVYGITKNSEVSDNYDRYNSMRYGYSQQEIDRAWKKADDARSSRNTAYIIGASALAIGVGVHIWF